MCFGGGCFGGCGRWFCVGVGCVGCLGVGGCVCGFVLNPCTASSAGDTCGPARTFPAGDTLQGAQALLRNQKCDHAAPCTGNSHAGGDTQAVNRQVGRGSTARPSTRREIQDCQAGPPVSSRSRRPINRAPEVGAPPRPRAAAPRPAGRPQDRGQGSPARAYPRPASRSPAGPGDRM